MIKILLVCPDETNAALVRDTGQLAYQLGKVGAGVGILTAAESDSVFADMAPQIRVFYSEAAHFWRSPLAHSLNVLLQAHESVEIVHLMNYSADIASLAAVCRKHAVPFALSLHNRKHLGGEGLSFWRKWRFKKALAHINPLIVPTQGLLQAARDAGLEHVALITEGVDTERFKPVMSKRPLRRALELPEKPTLVCCLADIVPENKQLELLELCAPLNENLNILLMGHGKNAGYMAQIIQKIEHNGWQKFVHIRKPDAAPEEVLKATDIFMLLGGIEGRRTTILQALACGVPVVLGASESSIMLTNSNKAGVVYYPENALACQAVEKLLNDPVYRQSRALQARPFVQKQHNATDTLQAYLRLYQSMAEA